MVVLSFRGVCGMDYSGAFDLVALGKGAAAVGCCVLLTELQQSVIETLGNVGADLRNLAQEDEPVCLVGLYYMQHYHAALKCCEDVILRQTGTSLATSLARYSLTLDSGQMCRSQLAKSFIEQVFGDTVGNDCRVLAELELCFKLDQHEASAVIWTEGDVATFCVGVVSGELHALQFPAKGTDAKRLVEVVGAGSFIGYGAMTNRMAYLQTLIVPAECKSCMVMRLTSEMFQELLVSRPQLALPFFQVFSMRSAYEFRELSRLVMHG